ncbi:response regulator transcription factor [Paenibacillus hamazuiensis]|uniref:response regulator transcription factor n=1 Tax=Paenibacillus hamazuiensis TaxID=2936508 RepID=UPI00200C02EE
MNIVIADDESLIRASLVSMISEMGASWHVAGEAATGEELVALVAAELPDIAIVDIRMPVMDGLTAIQRGKECSPLTKWLILSGFSDFEYAQKAVKLGASEYLLKPVDPRELESSLYRIYQDHAESERMLNRQFEYNLFSMIHELTAPDVERGSGDSLFYQGHFQGMVFYIDSCCPASRLADLQRELGSVLRDELGKHFTCGMRVAIVSLPGGELSVIGAWDAAKNAGHKDRLAHCFQSLIENLAQFQSKQSAVTAFLTGECSGFLSLVDELKQLQSCASLRPLYGIRRMWSARELSSLTETDFAVLGRLLILLAQHFNDKLYVNYHKTVDELEALLNKIQLRDHHVQAIRDFLGAALSASVSSPLSRQKLAGELRQFGEQTLLRMTGTEPGGGDLVERAIAYIEKHYMEDIGIGQIAGELNVTPNYLSSLFHKKTGCTFVKYLTRLRMYKAKELLAETGLQVQQVAEKVGYYSSRHFTKLFKDTNGVYPSDFKKNLGNHTG